MSKEPTVVTCLLTALLAVGVAGCAGHCTGDVRTDGVACAARGLSEGTYAAQTHAMAQSLETARATNAAEVRRASALSSDLAILQAQRQTLASKVEALLARLEDVTRRLDRQDARIAELQGVKAGLEAAARRLQSPHIDPVALIEEERGLAIYQRQLDQLAVASRSAT